MNASYLRDLAHRCAGLAHNCPHEKTSDELEAIAAELVEKAAEGVAESLVAPLATINTLSSDPLLILLRRYEAELAAFDRATETDNISDRDWSLIAEQTWSRTQDEIITRQPPATTATGALLALDHVLQNDDLFEQRTEFPPVQMLWLLVKAARDYIAKRAREN